jgi:multimeric flavodoxin WrbA
MNKNVIVISTSLRKGGNSDTLADELTRGAKDAGANVEKISLEGKTIGLYL